MVMLPKFVNSWESKMDYPRRILLAIEQEKVLKEHAVERNSMQNFSTATIAKFF